MEHLFHASGPRLGGFCREVKYIAAGAQTQSGISPKLQAMKRVTRTRTREGLVFHGRFYVLRHFCCKTAQTREMQYNRDSLDLPLKNTLRNIRKNCAKSPV
jgi:hypothetical protein